MSWYKKIKISSIKDDKKEQMSYFADKIEEAIGQALIGGNETIDLLDQLIDKVKGAHGFRNIMPPSTTKKVLSLMQEARKVKRDSPQKCCALLEEALNYLY